MNMTEVVHALLTPPPIRVRTLGRMPPAAADLIQLPTSSGASSRGSHQLACARECPLRYAFRYHLRLRPRIEPPFRLAGTLVHTHLAYHYAEQLDDPSDWFLTQTLDEALAQDGAGNPAALREATEVAEAYKHRWAGEPLRPHSVEDEYRATIGELDPGGPDPELDDEYISCKTDLVAEINGDRWVVDHKTQAGDHRTGRLRHWRDDGEYRINWQVLVNLMILRKRIGPIRGFVINRVKRVAPFDFDRHPLPIPVLAYQNAPRTARNYVRAELAIKKQIAAGDKPEAVYSACYGRYGHCDYVDVCAASSREEQTEILETQFLEG